MYIFYTFICFSQNLLGPCETTTVREAHSDVSSLLKSAVDKALQSKTNTSIFFFVSLSDSHRRRIRPHWRAFSPEWGAARQEMRKLLSTSRRRSERIPRQTDASISSTASVSWMISPLWRKSRTTWALAVCRRPNCLLHSGLLWSLCCWPQLTRKSWMSLTWGNIQDPRRVFWGCYQWSKNPE